MLASSSRAGVGTPKRVGSATSTGAGYVTDEQFRNSFEAVPAVQFSSFKELIAECQKHSAILENTNNDWSKRVKSLQLLRSILMSGAADNSEFINQCSIIFGSALQISVKDLRSQVCREACITIAYFCEKMGPLFWKISELIFPVTMNLVQNSAKVMASSAINFVRNPKLIHLLASFITSKAKDVRRCAISLISDIIIYWEPQSLEKNWPELIHILKLGIHDADVEARAFARLAYEALQASYPQRAEFFFQELEPAKQKILAGRSSTASSTHSINSERDNLQTSNRGLYAAQNAFLSKRSTSDLNHSIRKLNLGISHNRPVNKPNVIRSTKPPQSAVSATSTTSKINFHEPQPIRKALPTMKSTTNPVISTITDKSHKSSSQPGSRSTSPNKFRPIRSHIPPQHTNEKKKVNGGSLSIQNHNSNASIFTTNKTPHGVISGINNNNSVFFQRDVVRALKNVDMQARNVRPNIVRMDEDQSFALSPTTGFVNRNIGNRFTDSPINDVHASLYNKKHKNIDDSPVIKNFNGNLNGHEISKWHKNSQLLINDPSEQEIYVNDFCKLLQSNNGSIRNEKEIEAALCSISHKIRDGAITQWDDYFGPIFLALLHSISHYNNHCIKLCALRALKDLCQSQPQRLVQKPELAMLNVLNAHNCEDASIVRVAEDCAATLAVYLPTDVCLKLLITVIDDENTAYHQLSGAIKMLSRVIEKISLEEVQHLLPMVVSRMMKCYENSQSMVRRASIICLVAISNVIGMDILKPHLNASTLKLVEVYRDRMAKSK